MAQNPKHQTARIKQKALTTVGIEALVELVVKPRGLAQTIVVVKHAFRAERIRAQAGQ